MRASAPFSDILYAAKMTERLFVSEVTEAGVLSTVVSMTSAVSLHLVSMTTQLKT